MNVKKILVILILTILLISYIFPNYVQADFSDMGLDNPESYKGTNEGLGSMEGKVEAILGIIKVIGTVVSVIALIAIGIKYMLGSVEEKAEYKETLKPYIIGALVLFTGSLIPQIIYQFAQNI